jgi:hypothetical protein
VDQRLSEFAMLCDALAVLPMKTPSFAAGTTVDVIRL